MHRKSWGPVLCIMSRSTVPPEKSARGGPLKISQNNYSVLHIVLHNEIHSAAFDVTDSHIPTHP
jgi:hypothetical protein